MRAIVSVVALAACAPVSERAPTAELAASRAPLAMCDLLGDTVSGVSFSDEEATNTLDFVNGATPAELDAVYGIGAAIAGNLVASRPFADLTDLDAVAYIGPSVLTSLRDETESAWCALDDGRQSCCIDLACAGLGDTRSGVDFTDAEAQAVLDWANRATTDELMAVCQVGPVIADAIESARPLPSLVALDLVPFVSGFHLEEMRGTESSTCPLQGSVLDEWCATDSAHCVCE
ncbi:MAG: hypothetical protein EP330_10795 [Deltaproteobacteria bacterium]|nr:MAG: hypothetical protein EP330_10795 [Deltaproteobacteria bacterium]